MHLLQKPFSLQSLAIKVREMVTEPAATKDGSAPRDKSITEMGIYAL